jgi:hypothetical protein
MPTSLKPEPAPVVSALLAHQIRRIDELEFGLQRIVNWLDNDLPEKARETAIDTLKRAQNENTT